MFRYETTQIIDKAQIPLFPAYQNIILSHISYLYQRRIGWNCLLGSNYIPLTTNSIEEKGVHNISLPYDSPGGPLIGGTT